MKKKWCGYSNRELGHFIDSQKVKNKKKWHTSNVEVTSEKWPWSLRGRTPACQKDFWLLLSIYLGVEPSSEATVDIVPDLILATWRMCRSTELCWKWSGAWLMGDRQPEHGARFLSGERPSKAFLVNPPGAMPEESPRRKGITPGIL